MAICMVWSGYSYCLIRCVVEVAGCWPCCCCLCGTQIRLFMGNKDWNEELRAMWFMFSPSPSVHDIPLIVDFLIYVTTGAGETVRLLCPCGAAAAGGTCVASSDSAGVALSPSMSDRLAVMFKTNELIKKTIFRSIPAIFPILTSFVTFLLVFLLVFLHVS